MNDDEQVKQQVKQIDQIIRNDKKLTVEQAANIEAIVQDWIDKNVEFNPDNPAEFRLKTH